MDLGDALPFRAAFYDKPVEDGGVLTNPASVVLTVTLPDGDTATPTVTTPSTGQYVADYQTSDLSPEGLFTGRWLATFAGGATTSLVQGFDVGRSLVTVEQVVRHLRGAEIIDTAEADLEQIQWLTFVAANAIELVLDRVILPRTIIETHDGGGSVVLSRSPVLSVVSVSESGLVVTDLLPRLDAGILYRGSNYSPLPFARGWQNVTVTYRAGFNSPPPVIRKVALNAIQGMWQSSQQASHRLVDEFAADAVGVATAALTPLEREAFYSYEAAAIA